MSELDALVDNAAQQLQQQLIDASGKDGSGSWRRLIREAIWHCLMAPKQTVGHSIRVGSYELRRLGSRIAVTKISPKSRVPGLSPGGDDAWEIEQWEPKDIAKLKLWLNGE